jgi:hypothetical protein
MSNPSLRATSEAASTLKVKKYLKTKTDRRRALDMSTRGDPDRPSAPLAAPANGRAEAVMAPAREGRQAGAPPLGEGFGRRPRVTSAELQLGCDAALVVLHRWCRAAVETGRGIVRMGAGAGGPFRERLIRGCHQSPFVGRIERYVLYKRFWYCQLAVSSIIHDLRHSPSPPPPKWLY